MISTKVVLELAIRRKSGSVDLNVCLIFFVYSVYLTQLFCVSSVSCLCCLSTSNHWVSCLCILCTISQGLVRVFCVLLSLILCIFCVLLASECTICVFMYYWPFSMLFVYSIRMPFSALIVYSVFFYGLVCILCTTILGLVHFLCTTSHWVSYMCL